jgi:tetratricopeptide (TPR) repeat protein
MLTEREFSEAHLRILRAWCGGAPDEALAEVRKVLGEGTPDMKARALLLRGMIKDGAGAADEARLDWDAALRYSRAGTYLRFRLECQIGEALEREGKSAEAVGWYARALRTCAEGDEFSGHRALNAYLRLNGGKVAPDDEAVVASAAEKSWRVLELTGTPNLKDLPATIRDIDEGFSDLVRRTAAT